MKSIDKMSEREMRAELRRYREALERIAVGEDGCLASIYHEIARQALKDDE